MMKNEKVCPKCGSPEIFWALGLPQLWSIWECKKCNYRGVLILEKEEIKNEKGEEKDKQQIKKNEFND